jgi:hypothetical protein
VTTTAHDAEAVAPGSDQPSGFALGVGGPTAALLRFLRRFRLPVLALGKQHLYRVMLEGGGFELPLEPPDPHEPNPTGFFTTRFVAAYTRADAEAKAKAHVVREWQGLSLLGHFTKVEEPILTVTESEAIDGWFRSSKGGGFVFFTGSEADQNTP